MHITLSTYLQSNSKMGKMVRRKMRHSRHSEYAGTYRAICELHKEKETFLQKASMIGKHIENLQDSVKEQIKLEIPSKAIRLKMKINLWKHKQREKEERVESIIIELDNLTRNIYVPSDNDSSSDDEDGPDPNLDRNDDSSSDKQDSCGASVDSSSDEDEPLPEASAQSHDSSNSVEDEPLPQAPTPTSDISPPRCDVSTVDEYRNRDGSEDDSAVEGDDYSTESNSTSTNEEPQEEEMTLHWYETDIMDAL